MALTDLILEHYSHVPLRVVQDRLQTIRPDIKPNGLWVSVKGERDWPEWCEAEEYATYQPEECQRIHLYPDANVLLITSMDELDGFHAEFSLAPEWDESERSRMINWRAVANQFDGILIAPYQYQARFKYLWYYGWDCASGCIWNSRAIERVEYDPILAS